MRLVLPAVLAVLALAQPGHAQAPQPGAAAGPATPRAEAPGVTRPALPDLLREILRADPSILGDALKAHPAILGDALRENPLVLRDAFEALQALEMQDRDAAARDAIATNRDALFRDPADPVRGNPAGTVTLVEFFDARCPYCKQLHTAMGDLVRRNPDVRVVLKDLPVLGPNSLGAARALLAAQRQDRYGPLHDALMKLREDLTEPVIRREAEKLGIDWTRLRREMDDPAIAERIARNRRLAEQLRIEGTPAVLIGDTLLPGAVDLATLERLVEAERAKARRGG